MGSVVGYPYTIFILCLILKQEYKKKKNQKFAIFLFYLSSF